MQRSDLKMVIRRSKLIKHDENGIEVITIESSSEDELQTDQVENISNWLK